MDLFYTVHGETPSYGVHDDRMLIQGICILCKELANTYKSYLLFGVL